MNERFSVIALDALQPNRLCAGDDCGSVATELAETGRRLEGVRGHLQDERKSPIRYICVEHNARVSTASHFQCSFLHASFSSLASEEKDGVFRDLQSLVPIVQNGILEGPA